MCGRGFHPAFGFTWPTHGLPSWGREQAAATLDIVAREQAERRARPVDEDALARQKAEIVDTFERQASACVTSGLLLDDGVIDPRDTRCSLSFWQLAAKAMHGQRAAFSSVSRGSSGLRIRSETGCFTPKNIAA